MRHSFTVRSRSLLLACQVIALSAFAAKDPAGAFAHPVRVGTYIHSAPGGNLLVIPMDFAGDRTEMSGVADSLANAQIARVDIVYTDYPKGKDLAALNKRRLERLRRIAPDLFSAEGIEWRLVQQTACTTEAEARTLFHGVTILYRPQSTRSERMKEIAEIDRLLGSPTASVHGKKKTEAHAKTACGRTHSVEMGSADARTSGELTVAPIVPVFDVVGSGTSLELRITGQKIDSTVLKVMARNKWKGASVVCDLTGSMWPYTAQVVMWSKLTTKQDGPRDWVFFNDGDMKPDRMKKIGSTGGIYSTKTGEYEKVKDLATKTMMAGGGGDCPENNIEALLIAQERNPRSELVMVAGNWAPIKDKVLMSKVEQPVHVILCGVWGAVNVDYLDLARMTGGTLHTMESDLLRLAELNEGERFELDGQRFIIRSGRIERLGSGEDVKASR